MVVVDSFKERLNSGTFGNSLLTHSLMDFFGVTLNTGNDSVRVWLGGSTFIKVFNNDSLLSGKATL